MEHPEPQTALPSLSASQLDPRTSQAPSFSAKLQTSSWTSQLPRPDHGAPSLGTAAQQGPQLPPLVSLFDNTTFDLEEVQVEATPNPMGWTGLTTELQQDNKTTNATVGGLIIRIFWIFFSDSWHISFFVSFLHLPLLYLLSSPFIHPFYPFFFSLLIVSSLFLLSSLLPSWRSLLVFRTVFSWRRKIFVLVCCLPPKLSSSCWSTRLSARSPTGIRTERFMLFKLCFHSQMSFLLN